MKRSIIFLLFVLTIYVVAVYTPTNITIEENEEDQRETAVAVNPNNSSIIMSTWQEYRYEKDLPTKSRHSS